MSATPSPDRRESLATRWNRARYTLFSWPYDVVVRFGRQRKRAIQLLDLGAGERVLVVGAGTGADLPYLPGGVTVLATDLTPAMLARAKAKAVPGVELRVMDGQALQLPDESFDAVLLHLIVAVIPDSVACVREAVRVLRPGGRISVFDKFVSVGSRPGVLRRLANLPLRFLATDINRVLEEILDAAAVPVHVEQDEPAGFGSVFRIVILRKDA